jgi:hypothetical protein
MDHLTFTEFNDIFQRIPASIFRGNYTEMAINRALAKGRDDCQKRSHEANNQYTRTKIKNAAVNFDHLIHYGFAHRVKKEEKLHPNGPIAERLRRIEAERRMDAQRRGNMRYYKKPDNWRAP